MSAFMTAAQIREAFLSFFEKHAHARVHSSSLVPANDPTLLFVNAGMVQFKDVFTGREKRDYVRATSTQRCVRAGGKHNDLDNVGFTARHHTLFEMLGNFSFGDYFKSDAIKWGWEFVTEVIKLDIARLSVTVFKGEDGIPADEEAASLWAEAGVPKHRIHRLGKKDNFWAMGETGPCGPCSEIYVYLPDGPVNEDDKPGESENWLEIWNLVFMQFERKEVGGPLIALPKPSIDTGAGLERVTAIVQGKKSNYDTDLFTPILATVETLSGKKYGGSWTSHADGAMRVIADHARATAFLVADGVQPSNEGRGYVLRRMMRRAIRHGDSNLSLTEPFFATCCYSVISALSEAWPELKAKREFILEVAKHEEVSFRRTLENGRRKFTQEVARLKSVQLSVVSGAVTWDLHQTFGFPSDLTEVMAQEVGFTVDMEKFRLLKESAGDSESSLGSDKAIADVYLKLAGALPETKFTGYEGEGLSGQGRVLAILKNGTEVSSAKMGDKVEVILDSTCFYGESGGQVGDVGAMQSPLVSLKVIDTQKPVPSLFAHTVKVEKGELTLKDTLSLAVDAQRRNKIRANHSATHLLHKALKVVLGASVNQKGSVVNADLLRFDFSHFSPLTEEQTEQVEDLVNHWIRDNQAANTNVMDLEAARAAGAVALFGEKYGAKVRVVTVHAESTELCAGTHVQRSGDIGYFRIQQEMSVASGVRRIVALTGAAAAGLARQQEKHLRQATELLKCSPGDLAKRIEQSQTKVKELEKQNDDLKVKISLTASVTSTSPMTGALQVGWPEVNGFKIQVQMVETADVNLLKTLADRFRDQLQSGVVALGTTTEDGKALILVAATKDLVAKGFKAGDAIRLMAAEVGGKGGGKPDMAQAGGPDVSKIPEAFEQLKIYVKSLDLA
jgi:alanyl-tRNA synthetase